jgi:hypothetical protein
MSETAEDRKRYERVNRIARERVKGRKNRTWEVK